MRVMMMISPGAGHAYPMIPLGWGLQLAGHEVLAATSGPGLALGEAGVRCVDVAPGLSLTQMQATLARHRPDIIARLNDDALDPDYHETIGLAVAGALSYQPDLVDAMIRTAEEWRPDLIVYSPLLTPALVAAAKLGVPAVRNEFGMVRTDDSPQLMRELHGDLFAAHGVDLPEKMGTIDITPPSMGGIEPGAWQMAAVPVNGGGAMPDDVRTMLPRAGQNRPRIVATFGSGPAPRETELVVRNLIEAASGMDADVILAAPNVDAGSLGPLPGNVVQLEWAPLVSVMSGSSLVVHHGGPGSAFGAILSGVPQIIPAFGGLGRPLIMDAVAGRGVGLAAPPEKVDRALVESVLADEGMRAAVGEVREEIRSLPGPADVARQLEEFAAAPAGPA